MTSEENFFLFVAANRRNYAQNIKKNNERKREESRTTTPYIPCQSWSRCLHGTLNRSSLESSMDTGQSQKMNVLIVT